MEFYTYKHSFRQLEFSEIKELDEGEVIGVLVEQTPNSMKFENATIIHSLCLDDKDELSWKLDTSIGCIKVNRYLNNIYEIREL